MIGSVLLATFLAGVVESIETLTVVLAAGVTRSWKSAWLGVGTGVLLLTLIIAIMGRLILSVVPVSLLNVIIGLFLLLFGMRWLVKAILRYSGRKPMRDEGAAYQKSLHTMKNQAKPQGAFDAVAFSATWGATTLEGAEVAFTVISFGSLDAHMMPYSVLGAGLGIAVVFVLGLILRQPLTRAPENGIKFVVGVMLSALGTLWTGEGMGIRWILGPGSYLALLTLFLVFSLIMIQAMKRPVASTEEVPTSS